MKENDTQKKASEQSEVIPSHPVTFVSNDEPSPMPWPNTWYPVTPIGPETEYPCPCSEGESGTGSTDNNSVDFSIEFGRFPKWPELSGGRLMLNLNLMDASLCWGTVFQYEHVSQRRLEVAETLNSSIIRPEEPEDVSQVVMKTERGFPRYYSFASGSSSQADVLGGSQLFKDRLRRVTVDGVSYLEEVQENGMTMRFRPHSSVFDHIVTPRGVKITFAELAAELQVVRQDSYDEPGSSVESFNAFSYFSLKQVWNKTDGLLDLSDVRSIKWYAPGDVAGRRNDGMYTIRNGAVPIKTWKLSWTFGDMETVIVHAVDEENPEVTQMLLQTLRIEEPGGFVSEWRAGLYPDDLTLVKGEGDDAVSIVTMCRPADGHKNMIAKDVNGQAMIAGGYYTDKKEKFKYVYSGVAGTEGAVLCSAEKEVYQRRLYGDVLVSRTEGYGTPLERTWTYGYGGDPSSPNYGKRVRETRPDGSVVEMEYDSNGNVVQRTEPWYGDIRMQITYTYSASRFNDRRLLREQVDLVSSTDSRTLEATWYEYSEINGLVSETVNHRFIGRRDSWVKSFWYKNHDSCIYGNGRLYSQEKSSGVRIFYEYAMCSIYGAAWSCTETLLDKDTKAVVDGKSKRTIHYYAENGDEVAVDQQVHVEGEGFVSVDFRQMTYDSSHRVIRTNYANGLCSSAEWSCAGPLWETDVRGLQTRYSYDGAKRLVRVERDAAVPVENWNGTDMTVVCPDTVAEMVYDGVGRTRSITTAIGDRSTVVSTTYDMLGRVISRTDELGRTTGYSYSLDGLTRTEILPTGATLVTRHLASGLLVEESGTGQEARHYSYEVLMPGILKRTRRLDEAGEVVEEALQEGGGNVMALYRPYNGSLSLQYDAGYDDEGRATFERMGNAWPEEYQYDIFSGDLAVRLLSDVTTAGRYPRRYDYQYSYKRLDDSVPGLGISVVNLVFQENKSSVQADGISSVTEYSYKLLSGNEASLSGLDSLTLYKDAYGRWFWEKMYNENGNVRIVRGREDCVSEEENVILNGDIVRLTDTDGRITRYKRVYNTNGDTLTVRDARGNDIIIISDASGRETSRTDQDGKITTTAYDAVTGLPNCVTTPDGKQVWSAYDSRGRMVRQYGTGVQPMKWEYDAMDRIVALHTYRSSGSTLDTVPSSGSDVTRWNYDPVTGVLLNKTYANGSKTSYAYDDWGRVLTRKQARGVLTTYGYDAATGKVSSINHGDGTPSVSIDYDAMGRISTVQDASGIRRMTYIGLEDVSSETTTGLTSSVLSYQRDSVGRPSGYVFSLNGTEVQQVALGYDSMDRLSTASLNGMSFTYGYDSVTGWLNSLSYPNGLVKNTAFHDNLPLPVSLTYVKGGASAPAIKHAYTWDNMRRPSVQEDYVDSSALSRRHAYAYNARGELTGDTMNAGGSFSYAYDNIGNRRTAAELEISSSYQGNNLNQYTSVTRSGTTFAPVYDADGNQTSVNTFTGVWSVQYNADNRPIAFMQGSKKVECVYDYLGRRVEKVEYDGNNLTRRTRFSYMGYLMVASMDCTQNISNPTLLGTWFWDPSEPVATRVLAMCTHNVDKSVEMTRYVTHDLLKSVSALFDSSGTRQAKFEYTPYGETLTAEGTWASSMAFRYSGDYRDGDLGLIYYNYRHYNPQEGRWISRDPIEESGGIHLYGFARNNPSYFYDILGIGFDAQTFYDNGKIRIDCETYGDKSGKGNLHIHYNGTKYAWHTKKNNFISEDGKILKLKRITQTGDADEILKKLKKGFDKVNSTGGFAPKYGGGTSAGGFLLAFTIVIGLQEATAGMQEYVDAVVNSKPDKRDEAIKKVVENVPSSLLMPTGLKSLIYDKLTDPKIQRDIKRYMKKEPVKRMISISDVCCCKYKCYA